jgi:subtilisin family serine protease
MKYKWLIILISMFILIAFIGLAQRGLYAAAQVGSEKVDTLLINKFTSNKNVDFIVIMSEQADLSKAADLKTKEEKGQFVFGTLISTAERTQNELRIYLESQNVDYESYYIINAMWVKSGTLALAETIADRPDVKQIVANQTYHLEEPIINQDVPNVPQDIEPNISFVGTPNVWALGITGQGTVLAGNDTGIDWDHPALIRQYRGCLNPPICDQIDHNYNWWDATGTYPTVPNDGNSHGTHTTGTMVGDDGAGNQIGMAPGARMIHCKLMDDNGNATLQTVLDCFQWDLAPWDLDHRNPDPSKAPDTINNSWGATGGGNDSARGAVDALQAAGIVMEFSAGNEGLACQTLRSPGDYQEVLTTGSVNHASAYPGT